jgi:hypothetical protein
MSDPWLPTRVPGFSPWIEGDKLPDDVPDDARVQYLLEDEKREQSFWPISCSAKVLRESAFVAYCVQEV